MLARCSFISISPNSHTSTKRQRHRHSELVSQIWYMYMYICTLLHYSFKYMCTLSVYHSQIPHRSDPISILKRRACIFDARLCMHAVLLIPGPFQRRQHRDQYVIRSRPARDRERLPKATDRWCVSGWLWCGWHVKTTHRVWCAERSKRHLQSARGLYYIARNFTWCCAYTIHMQLRSPERFDRTGWIGTWFVCGRLMEMCSIKWYAFGF